MLNRLLLTLKYSFSVERHKSIPSTMLPHRMGCANSDMFKIDLDETDYQGGVSLAEYHAAFLNSNIFRLELFLLTKFTSVDPVTTSPQQLMAVAMGEKSTFGPWTAWAVEGTRTKRIGKGDRAACQIMQCRVNDKPFCDTWWAVEYESDRPSLVFGTSMVYDGYPFLLKLLGPLHRVYSCLLLAAAKATLVMEGAKKVKKCR